MMAMTSAMLNRQIAWLATCILNAKSIKPKISRLSARTIFVQFASSAFQVNIATTRSSCQMSFPQKICRAKLRNSRIKLRIRSASLEPCARKFKISKKITIRNSMTFLRNSKRLSVYLLMDSLSMRHLETSRMASNVKNQFCSKLPQFLLSLKSLRKRWSISSKIAKSGTLTLSSSSEASSTRSKKT